MESNISVNGKSYVLTDRKAVVGDVIKFRGRDATYHVDKIPTKHDDDCLTILDFHRPVLIGEVAYATHLEDVFVYEEISEEVE